MKRRIMVQGTSRRGFLKQVSLFGAAVAGLGVMGRSAFGAEAFPVVETAYGKVRGMDTAGIKTFRGIRYGASTAGANRFMPPVKPEKWTGVFDAFGYGDASPQMPGNPADAYTQAVNWDAHVKTGMSEDCLVLNVWTPALGDGGNRPVFFYIHGGGYTNGSGGITFDGDPLARMGNAVVITLNHRLGVFGFLDVGQVTGSAKFASASAVGLLDLVAALEWVRENVARFGGNPGNVTLMGQSGGGGKISNLMVMPAAKGLFHKAVLQSGSTLTLGPRERGVTQGTALLAELGVSKEKPEDLQNLPWSVILQAQNGRNFGPVVDGVNVPRNPFDPDAPAISADVPMIIGYTKEDASLHTAAAARLTEEGLVEWGKVVYPETSAKILEAYKKAYPGASPFLIQSRIRTDAGTRLRALTMASRKAAQKKGAAYVYEIAWAAPVYGGRFGATHGTDLGLVFGNPRDPIAGNTAEARKMAEMVGSAIVAFGKTGNPNCDKVPQWAAYGEERATMILDLVPKVENDPGRELRLLWEAAR